MVEDHKQNKPPPTPVIQAVSSIAMAEAILLSKSLGIPPPLPPIGMPADQQQGQQQQLRSQSDQRLATPDGFEEEMQVSN